MVNFVETQPSILDTGISEKKSNKRRKPTEIATEKVPPGTRLCWLHVDRVIDGRGGDFGVGRDYGWCCRRPR